MGSQLTAVLLVPDTESKTWLRCFAGVSESAFQHYRGVAEREDRSDMDGFVACTEHSRAPARLLIEYCYAPAVIGGVAEQIHADLIVMGAQGCSQLSYILLGSMTLHTMQDAVCDVAAFRQCGGRENS